AAIPGRAPRPPGSTRTERSSGAACQRRGGSLREPPWLPPPAVADFDALTASGGSTAGEPAASKWQRRRVAAARQATAGDRFGSQVPGQNPSPAYTPDLRARFREP